MTTNDNISGVQIRPISLPDTPKISALHARVFGPGRFSRTAYRIREGAPKVSRFCRQALIADTLVAAVSFTEIQIGGVANALLLGPLAVAPEQANQGLGRLLIAAGLDEANRQGIALVVLVGDEPYYARFGFQRVAIGQIQFPGPVDPNRILAWQSTPNAIDGYAGKLESVRHK